MRANRAAFFDIVVRRSVNVHLSRDNTDRNHAKVKIKLEPRSAISYKMSMDTISYSELAANLKSAIDKVVNDHDPIAVKRAKGGDAILLARDFV